MPDLFSANPGGDPSHDRAFAALAPTSRPIGMRTEPMVNARNLHGFLAVSNHFKDWITDRIEQYGFLENQDFVSLAENSAKPQGGRPSKEYYLILDMAKELAMVERNEKGRQARRYFLECERRAKSMIPVVDFNDLRSVRDYLATVIDKAVALEAKVAEDAPKVALAEAVSAAKNSQDFMDVAHALGIGRQTLINLLREAEHLQPGSPILPYRKCELRGWYEVEIRTRQHSKTGEPVKYDMTLVTSKGLDEIQKLLAERGKKKRK